MSNNKELTLGELRVRTQFNPSDSGIIHEIKTKCAELINLINDIKLEDCPGEDPKEKHEGIVGLANDKVLYSTETEFNYNKEKACRAIEEASAFGVKAATVKL